MPLTSRVLGLCCHEVGPDPSSQMPGNYFGAEHPGEQHSARHPPHGQFYLETYTNTTQACSNDADSSDTA